MKSKFIFYTRVLLLVALAAACGHDTEIGGADGSADGVTLGAAIDRGLSRGGTLAVPDGHKLRHVLEVWTTGDNAALVHRDERVTADGAGSVRFEFRLTGNGAYTALFWADFVKEDAATSAGTSPNGDAYTRYADNHYATTPDLMHVALADAGNAYTVNDDSRDAFFARVDIEKGTGAYKGNATLVRPFGQLNLAESDAGQAIADVTSVTLAYSVPGSFNVATGMPGEPVVVRPAASTLPVATATRRANLAYDYIFAPAEPAQTTLGEIVLAFTNDAAAGYTFTDFTVPANIPVARNRRTNVRGSILHRSGSPTGSTKLSVTMTGGWNDADDTDGLCYIPDNTFRRFCIENGYANADGFIIPSAAAAVTGALDLSSMGIMSLAGIEFFTGITELNCSDNVLTALDVSGCTGLTDLYCSGNALETLNVSSCTGLTDLYCSYNSLETLDVSGCTGLEYLKCSYNSLETLDVSGCTGLTDLYCSDNRLATLNVSSCTGLTNLDCSDNRLATLDVSGCTGLARLYCSDNSLETLDVSGCPGLTALDCSDNSLETLNVSGCTGLTYLPCFNNRLATLDASKMSNISNWALYCGNQTTDGSSSLTLTLTLRANQKERWESPLKSDPNNQNVTPIYSEP